MLRSSFRGATRRSSASIYFSELARRDTDGTDGLIISFSFSKQSNPRNLFQAPLGVPFR
jgi:hypothetical protein